MISQIEVVTKTGERYMEQASYPKGHIRNPMSDADVESKFNEMCRANLQRERCQEILDAVRSLEDVQDAGEVLELVRIEKPQ